MSAATAAKWNRALGKWARKRLGVSPPLLPTRFFHEVDVHIDRADSGLEKFGSVRAARAVVIYCLTSAFATFDELAVKYMERARQRYLNDPRKRVAKALGLEGSRRGAPTGRTGKLTPGMREEVGLMVWEKVRNGATVTAAVEDVAKKFRLSTRTIHDAKERIPEIDRKRRTITHKGEVLRRVAREADSLAKSHKNTE